MLYDKQKKYRPAVCAAGRLFDCVSCLQFLAGDPVDGHAVSTENDLGEAAFAAAFRKSKSDLHEFRRGRPQACGCVLGIIMITVGRIFFLRPVAREAVGVIARRKNQGKAPFALRAPAFSSALSVPVVHGFSPLS